ncbi:MAG TPA: hypothetical protein VFM77_19660 [Terriglobales bacterium]|nr:hypothetical protein [Terriglobales bacterium]
MKRLALILLSLAVVSGCTSESPQQSAKPEPAELLTGRSAFQKLYVTARGWAPDVRPYQLQSGVVGDNKGRDGKAVVWSAAFASAAIHTSKPYTWSGVDAPDAPSRGVTQGTQDTSFTPTNTFDMQFLKIDSDKAFEISQKHGGEGILQKKPDTPVLYHLDWNHSGNNLVWHVMYGGTGADAALTNDIDATSGEFLRKEK